jgi:hypothetical protein
MPLNINDVLGGLADAFLMQAGHNPMYQQIKDQNELENVNLDFDNDPMGTINQINQIAPELVPKYMQMMDTRDYHKALTNVAGRRMDNTEADSELKRQTKARGYIASTLMAARGDPDAYKAAVIQAQKLGNNLGIDLTDLPTDPNDHQGILAWGLGNGMSVNNQVKATQNDAKQAETEKWHQENLPIKQQTADAATTRAGASAAQAGVAAQRQGVYAGINTNPDGTPIRMTDPGRHPTRESGRVLPGSAPSQGQPLSVPPRPGNYVGEVAHNPRTNQVLKWDGSHWK